MFLEGPAGARGGPKLSKIKLFHFFFSKGGGGGLRKKDLVFGGGGFFSFFFFSFWDRIYPLPSFPPTTLLVFFSPRFSPSPERNRKVPGIAVSPSFLKTQTRGGIPKSLLFPFIYGNSFVRGGSPPPGFFLGPAPPSGQKKTPTPKTPNKNQKQKRFFWLGPQSPLPQKGFFLFFSFSPGLFGCFFSGGGVRDTDHPWSPFFGVGIVFPFLFLWGQMENATNPRGRGFFYFCPI